MNKIHWSVEFKDKSYSFRATDTVSVGDYQYDAQTGAVTTANKSIHGSFDAKTGILTWGKNKYRAADAK